jgi:hypothetical protein
MQTFALIVLVTLAAMGLVVVGELDTVPDALCSELTRLVSIK